MSDTTPGGPPNENPANPSPDIPQAQQLLLEVAGAVSLREGPEGVRKALWELRAAPRSTQDWARAVRIPVPVVAAMRGELESRGMLRKGPHPTPTEAGQALMDALFGSSAVASPVCPMCRGRALLLPPELTPLLEMLEPVLAERPQADPVLDQSHALPASSLLRALMAATTGSGGGDVFFMGDDDLASVALAILLTEEMPDRIDRFQITVADIDRRYLSLIARVYDELGLSVETVHYDARDPLPESLRGRYRTALTDPPYTPDGIALFAWRCAEALHAEEAELLLAYAPQPPAVQHAIQKALIAQGWRIEACYHDAARYAGSSVHAHASDLYHLQMHAGGIGSSPDIVNAACYSTLYTGQLREPGGTYRCTACGAETTVGPGRPVATIADLKQAGCTVCGGGRFHRYGQGSED